MKMPAPKGVITVFGNQQEARNIEKGHTPGQTNVYQLKAAEETKKIYEEPAVANGGQATGKAAGGQAAPNSGIRCGWVCIRGLNVFLFPKILFSL
jgi:hypothetical protein